MIILKFPLRLTRLLIGLLFLLISFHSLSQTNPYSSLLDHAPTNTLHEHGFWASLSPSDVNLLHHSGVIDSINDYSAYVQEHALLARSCTPATMPDYGDIESFEDFVDSTYWGFDPVGMLPSQILQSGPPDYDGIISISDWDFNTINPYAVDSGWVYMDENDSLYKLRTSDYTAFDTIIDPNDSAAFYASYPRDTSTYFLDTAYITVDSAEVFDITFENHRYLALGIHEAGYVLTVSNNTAKFYLPEELMFLNKSSSLYIDFDNGDSPYPVTPDGTYDITYLTEGTYNVRLLQDPECTTNECIRSTFKITIAFSEGPNTQFAVDNGTIVNQCELDYSLSSELKSFSKDIEFGAAVVSTWLRDSNPDPEGRITRPVIVVDGFNSYGPESAVHDKPRRTTAGGLIYGNINPQSISSGVYPAELEDNDGYSRALDRFSSFIDSVTASDYDFVFVDWYTNRAAIQANAHTLQEIIQQVNKEMQLAESTEEIIVIGPSMGGQIARVAIREMELAECCHNVRLYVSFDSPHRGANIPLSLQHLVKNLFTRFDLFNDTNSDMPQTLQAQRTYQWVLASPAARQMLVEHIEGNEPSENYYNYINSIGFPEQPELIAVVNGSHQGTLQGNRQYIDSTNNMLVASTQTPLMPGDEFLTMKANLHAPTEIPTLSFGDFYEFIGPDLDWSLIYAKAYVIENDPNGSINQLLLERGKTFDENLTGYIGFLTAMGTYNYLFYKTGIVHDYLVLQNIPPPSNCVLCPLILGSKAINLAAISAAGQLTLNGMLNINNHRNYNITSDDIYHQRTTLGWDNSPGSFITTPGDLADLSAGMVTVNQRRHTFMPTVSTIALMGTDDFNIDISSISDPELLASTPFSAIYFNYSTTNEGAISHNQEHVEVTVHGIRWIMNQIRNSERIPDGQLNAQGEWELSSSYNFGSPELEINSNPALNISLQYIPSVKVLSGASLLVNSPTQGLGFGGPQQPKEASYSIGTNSFGCNANNSIVEVSSGGLFKIGHGQTSDYAADVIFKSGSKLVLTGDLEIDNKSRLIIETGAELIINPGSSIELLGSESELVIKGKLIVNQNADFAPSGDGLVRFAQAGMTYGNSTNFIVANGNNEFRMIRTDSSKVHLRIDETTFLTQSWDSVVVSNIGIEIADNNYFDVRAKLRAERVSVDISSEGNPLGDHGGFRFYGFNPSTFKNNTIKNGKFGVFVNALVGTDNSKVIEGCIFKFNDEAISTRGGDFIISNCSFVQNNTGLRLKDFSNNSQISRSGFYNNGYGIHGNSPSNQSLNISTSIFEDNLYGLIAEEVVCYISCNEFDNQQVGIESILSKIQSSNSALNSFTNNDTVIKLTDSEELYLKSGFNDFDNNTYTAVGQFSFSSGSGNLVQNGTLYELDMKDNYPNQTPISLMTVDLSGTIYTVKFVNTSFSTLFNSCNQVKGPNNGSNKSNFVITSSSNLSLLESGSIYNAQQLGSGYFTGMPLSGAVHSLLARDSVNEVATCDSLYSIVANMNLTSTLDSLTFMEISGVCSKVLMSYEDHHANNLLQQFELLLSSYAMSSSGNMSAEVSHLLSSIARHSGNYSLAISWNQSAISSTTNNKLLTKLQYWSCVLSLENDLLSGSISLLDYDQQEQQCRLSYLSSKSGVSNSETSADLPEESDWISIYPNPTRDCSVIELKNVNAVKVMLRSASGEFLRSFELDSENDHAYLCSENLESGVYLISVYDQLDVRVETMRWVITK